MKACVCACICVCVFLCVNIFVYICVYVCVFVHACIFVFFWHSCLCRFISGSIHLWIKRIVYALPFIPTWTRIDRIRQYVFPNVSPCSQTLPRPSQRGMTPKTLPVFSEQARLAPGCGSSGELAWNVRLRTGGCDVIRQVPRQDFS